MPRAGEVNVVEIDATALHALAAHDLDGLGVGGCPLDVDESGVGYGHSTILQSQPNTDISISTSVVEDEVVNVVMCSVDFTCG
jgi:hypothetical protein